MPISNSSVSLGLELKQRRIELKLSASAVAARADISASYYSSIEKDRQIPPVNTLARVIKALCFCEEAALKIKELAATGRGLSSDDAELPEEIQALIVDIRKAANAMPPRFIRGLRTKIREISH